MSFLVSEKPQTLHGPEEFDNSGKGPLMVPGFGLKLDCAVKGPHFSSGIKGWHPPRLLVRELAMLQLMDAITDKPNWHVKIFDEIIVERWHNEATAMPLISENAWTWCLRELREKASDYAQKHYVLTYDTSSRIAKSDELLTPELRAELIHGTYPLLDVPPGEQDWHPGTDGKVLNLVHPSLYPLVYGRTRVLTKGGRVDLQHPTASMNEDLSEVAPEQTPTGDWAYSSRFQWLPCDVEFSGPPGSTDVRITSYINNIEPYKHESLYTTIEKLVGLAIPMWNDVLVRDEGRRFPFRNEGVRTPCRIITYGTKYTTQMPDWCEMSEMPSSVHDEDFDEFWAKVEAYLNTPNRPNEHWKYEDWGDILDETELSDALQQNLDPMEDIHIRLRQKLNRLEDPKDFKLLVAQCIGHKWERNRVTAHPEPGVATTYEDWKHGKLTPDVGRMEYGYGPSEMRGHRYDIALQDEFRDRGLQVIVKLASIELSPEKPEYEGGSWHLEGMLNEHIVATALFYYDVENVSDSRLVFRQEAYLDDDDLNYEQSVHEPLCTVFGTTSMDFEPAVQELGAILTNPAGAAGVSHQAARVLAFPNTLQHSVAPFSLIDRTKRGHRRFAVLWLVDPHYRICSTANVPPQRHNWTITDAIFELSRAKPFLPMELIDKIKNEVGDYPMGRDEAECLRLELMAERTRLMPRVESQFERYNLCEH